MNSEILEGGLTYDDGHATTAEASKLAASKQVAWKRQARAYNRLRDEIDAHLLRTPRDGICIELPQRLSGWRGALSAQIRETWPELDAAVRSIHALTAQRAAMQADKTYIPASPFKRVPLPTDPQEREAERRRREIACMRRLRERRRLERNLDLIGE
jgi:LmbE family N-acetylglucosaminyl deacetylase